MTGFQERYYSAQDGLRLYFRDYGDPGAPGSPILCLSGLARNAKDYHALASRLATDRRILCPDLRGRGRSAYDPDWHNYNGPTYLSDLIHLLTLTNCHHVVVVGTSMGGLLAMGLAVFLPSAIAAVVLNDVGPEVPAPASNRILSYIGEGGSYADWPAAVTYLRKVLPNLSLNSEAAWQALARDTFREDPDGRVYPDWDPAIVRPLTEGTDEVPDLWRLFRALSDHPVLAFRGEFSDVLTPDIFARMKQELPDLLQCVVPATGHCPTLDEPPARAALDAFLSRH